MIKVMLLEDDPTMLSLLETLLEIEGYNVKKISNIDQTIAEVQAFMPEIILMDVNLDNGFDGKKLLTSIKSEESLKDIKIIMTSGLDLKKECISIGAEDFLQKPYSIQTLAKKVREVLDKN